jgi:hypothetical protein
MRKREYSTKESCKPGSPNIMSCSMAALGYRKGSVRSPLASRKVFPNNGKFHLEAKGSADPGPHFTSH